MGVSIEEDSSIKSKNKTDSSTKNDKKNKVEKSNDKLDQNEEEENQKTKNSNETIKEDDVKKIKKKNEADNDEEKEEDEESLKDIDEEDQQNVVGNFNSNVGKKSFLGHTCSVKTLIDDKVLDPENNSLSFEFMGKTFYADLLPNGGIRWTENKQTFSTPSSWVNFCKRTMTTENINKSVSAWSTIKYHGKRLDSYKLRWYRKQKKNFQGSSINNFANNLTNSNNDSPLQFDVSNRTSSELLKKNVINNDSLMSDIYFSDDAELNKKRNVIDHSELPLKKIVGSNDPITLSCNQLVKTVPFSSIERIQPFKITISTHALLLIDFHSHLTSTEVVGYLAGTWDAATLHLSILQAFPCRVDVEDKDKAKSVEEEVIQSIRQRKLSLIGWYHNHYNKAAQPSVKDIECQLSYQSIMYESEIQYLPCVGLICSPYDPYNKDYCSSLIAYWVLPPLESNQLEYGKPFHLYYQTTRDSFLTQDLLLEMRLLAHYYMNSSDKIDFNNDYKKESSEENDQVKTFWDKLKYSIKPNLPSDLQVSNELTPHQANLQQQALLQFWTFLKGLLIKSNNTKNETDSIS